MLFFSYIFQALNIDNHNVEGLLLKGAALLELKKMQEAIMHFREAIRLSPYRFEAYKGKYFVSQLSANMKSG